MPADLTDRTVLVTGTTSGIGRPTAEALAARGATVLLGARNPERNAAVVAAIRSTHPNAKVEALDLDVSSFASVRAAAGAILTSGRPLDVLINNAGVANTTALSADGIDLTYATNHLGPFLLTELLLPRLLQSPQGRVVNVASEAHRNVKRVDWALLAPRTEPRKSGFLDYSATKLMNILHAAELARRTTGSRLTVYSLHPGVVASDIWRSIPSPVRWLMKKFMLSNEEGAATSLYCATDPGLATVSGRYYEKSAERYPSRLAQEPALARELWERSARVAGIT